MFELVGEEAQAAALRLEHVATLRDVEQRLASLREGCARATGETEQGRMLHRTLARTLLVAAESIPDGARRRGLLLEAATALEEADEGEEAGDLYERLGLLQRAAKAYEAAGAIGRLEVTLATLEHQREADDSVRALEREIDGALREGRRSLAHALMAEHAQRAGREVRGSLDLSRRLQELELALPRRRRLVVRLLASGHPALRLLILGGPSLRIGRDPSCDVVLAGASISRTHVQLEIRPGEDAPTLSACDLGSRTGTFLDGLALAPGAPTPIERPGKLALGLSSELHVVPWRTHDGHVGALIVTPAETFAWLPKGGVLVHPEATLALLDGAQDPEGPLAPSPLPVLLHWDDPYVWLVAQEHVPAWLSGTPLGPGGGAEVLIGDRVRIGDDDALVVEVLG
jgi:hypothetical protein